MSLVDGEHNPAVDNLFGYYADLLGTHLTGHFADLSDHDAHASSLVTISFPNTATHDTLGEPADKVLAFVKQLHLSTWHMSHVNDNQ